MTALSDLRSRVLAGSGDDTALNEDILAWLHGLDVTSAWGSMVAIRPLLSDLNAVIALTEEKLPGWAWSVGNLSSGAQAYVMRRGGVMVGGNASSPARALLTALLEALETKDDA